MFTNKPPCGPKRGHGTPQPRFGQEVQLDKIAETLGIDPAELRLGNMARRFADRELAARRHHRPRRVHRQGGRGLRLEASGTASCPKAAASGSPARRTSAARACRSTGTTCRTRACSSSSTAAAASHGLLRRDRDRPGLGRRARRRGGRGARHRPVRHPRGHRRHRPHAGRPRLLLEPRHADDGQRRDPGGRAARAARSRGSARSSGSRPTASPSPGARVFDAESRNGRDLPGGGGARRGAFGTLGTTGSYTPPKRPAKFKGAGVGPSPAYSLHAAVVEVEVDPETGWITCRRSGSRTTSAARSTRRSCAGRSRAASTWASARR